MPFQNGNKLGEKHKGRPRPSSRLSKNLFKKGDSPYKHKKNCNCFRCNKETRKLQIKNNHPNWKGGLISESIKQRTSVESKLWKKSVFIRDNYTCQKTKICGGKLVAHHINNFADFPELRLAIDNGITLSQEEHLRFHKIYGRRNNTKEQLIDFLSKKFA